eukprot:jgi/Bigna1/85714/estExt_fgenesh1_pg.C_50304
MASSGTHHPCGPPHLDKENSFSDLDSVKSTNNSKDASSLKGSIATAWKRKGTSVNTTISNRKAAYPLRRAASDKSIRSPLSPLFQKNVGEKRKNVRPPQKVERSASVGSPVVVLDDKSSSRLSESPLISYSHRQDKEIVKEIFEISRDENKNLDAFEDENADKENNFNGPKSSWKLDDENDEGYARGASRSILGELESPGAKESLMSQQIYILRNAIIEQRNDIQSVKNHLMKLEGKCNDRHVLHMKGMISLTKLAQQTNETMESMSEEILNDSSRFMEGTEGSGGAIAPPNTPQVPSKYKRTPRKLFSPSLSPVKDGNEEMDEELVPSISQLPRVEEALNLNSLSQMTEDSVSALNISSHTDSVACVETSQIKRSKPYYTFLVETLSAIGGVGFIWMGVNFAMAILDDNESNEACLF